MNYQQMINDIQRSLNSLTNLEITATESNMRHLFGAMTTLAAVRDALKAEAEEVARAESEAAAAHIVPAEEEERGTDE